MTRPSFFWRSLIRLERHLPAISMTPAPGRARTMAQRLALLPVLMMPALVPMIRHHGRFVVDAWSTWRPVILDLLVVVAVATLVAAIGAGLHAWRRPHA